jgi:hypothetical protein
MVRSFMTSSCGNGWIMPDDLLRRLEYSVAKPYRTQIPVKR